MMLAKSSDSQKNITQTIKRYETLVSRDAFGFSGDNFKEILPQLLNCEVKDNFKQGETLEQHSRPVIRQNINLKNKSSLNSTKNQMKRGNRLSKKKIRFYK